MRWGFHSWSSRAFAFSLALVCAGYPALCRAQEPPVGTENPPQEANDSQPPQASQGQPDAPPPSPTNVAEKPEYAQARERVQRGEALFDAGNFDAALVEYEKAYELFVDHPLRAELLYNIALCHERRFRYTQALTYYARYLEDAGPQGESRAEVEGALRALGNLLARVEIKSNVPSEVWVDDNLVGEAPGLIMVPTGIHTVELRARGYESAQQELRVTARESTTLNITLDQLSGGLHPAWFYSGLGATLASAAVGAVFATQLSAKHDDLTGSESDKLKARPGDQDDLDSLALRADIFFATAGVLAVGTTLLALFTDFDKQDEAPKGRATKVGLSLEGLSLRGQF